jgi:diguanylate cyclase (GGDEF)-like protein/PAS domain S-box-containing protein
LPTKCGGDVHHDFSLTTLLLVRLCAGLIACAVLGMALPSTAHATVRDYYFTRIGSDQGLAQNTVTTMIQDPQGFVWVGTQGGLHRYDGQHYTSYRNDSRNPASLPDSLVTSLALEGDRALWVGSYSQFLARIDLGTGRIERFSAGLGRNVSQAERQVMAVLPRDGKLWVGTLAGLDRFDPATGQREKIIRLEPNELRVMSIQQLVADSNGTIWYANSTGLYQVQPDGQWRRVGDRAVTSSLLLDGDGLLWVGRSDGLFRVLPDGELEQAWPTAGGKTAANVRALVQAPDGSLWFSVLGDGLRRFDVATGGVRRINQMAAVDAGLPEDTVGSLLVDQGGMLWIGGLLRGVAVTDPRGARFPYIFDQKSRLADGPAANDSIRAIHEGTEKDVLWISTDHASLLRYDVAQDHFEDWTGRLPVTAGNAPETIGIADVGDGRLWLATTAGLLRLSPDTGQVEKIDLGEFSDVGLDSILVDRHGNLWLGTGEMGALTYHPGSGKLSLDYSNQGGLSGRQLSHPRVRALLEDRQGRIWFGTGDGVDRLDPASGTLKHFRHDPSQERSLPGNLVRALHETSDGSIWIGTHSGLSQAVDRPDGGVDFIQPLTDAFNERPNVTVFNIAESPATPGELWLGTDTGVVRLDIDAGHVRVYGLADGLQDLEFNGGAATTLADGRIAMGGVRGLNLFDPAKVKDSTYQPPLRLLSAKIGADTPTDASALWQPMRLDVPDGAHILRLRIGALDFAPAANIRYRYRMEGFDRGWIDNGTQSAITYTRLPPGAYTFRAQATNRDGVWSPNELQIPVEVALPWWRHPLVISLFLLTMLVLAITLGWNQRRRRQHEQNWFRQLRERDEHLKLALWASGEQFWDFNLSRQEMHRMQVHESSSTRPEISVERQVSNDLLIHDDDLPQVKAIMRRHLRGETALFMSEHRARNAGDSDWYWVRARGRVVERDADGRALRVAGTARDVTANRNAERERRIASEVLRSMAEAVAVFDQDFHFISVNPAFSRMTGYQQAEVVGRSTSLLDSSRHEPDFHLQLRSELRRDGRWSGEVWQQCKDGSEFLCWLQMSVVVQDKGRHNHYVAVLGDITDQKRTEQELRYLANYDPLTGLPNRTLLLERLAAAIVRARASQKRIGVLFLDLDRFKDINDSLGHAAGDRILRAAANRIQRVIGARQTVARLGGDEFMVVLEELDDAAQADKVSGELIAAFEAPLEFEHRHDVVISPSIGISLYPDDAQIASDLIKHADTAMYRAKAVGRRTFMRYVDTMDVEVHRRATLSAALRTVLDRGELSLVFQPRLSLFNNTITGVEALLRWHSPVHGEIPPSQFIPLAEESGMILEIGEWALREACHALRHWRADGLMDVPVAVNVSSLQLLRGDFPQLVTRVLAETGIPANHLELELTESVLMANPVETAATLQEFRQLGVNLAIDDFGTGYSSLSYLKRLPITMLKIDKEFIDDLAHDVDDAAITSTIIAMGHSLGLIVVAEGVENHEQAEFLRRHGCDEIQGFWLARPMPSDQLRAFLHQHANAPAPAESPAG